MTQPIDRAFVEVVPDTSNFARDLDQEISQALRELDARVKKTTESIEKEFREAGDAIGDHINRGVGEAAVALSTLEGKEINITANVDLDDAAARLQIEELEKKTITIKVELDFDVITLQTKLQASLNRIARRRAVVKIPVDIDIRDALRQLRFLQRIVNQTFRLRIRVVIDEGILIAQLAALKASIGDLDINVNTDTDGATRSLSRLQRMLALVAAAIVAVSVAIPEIAAAIPFLVSGINAIASLTGLLVGIPAAISLAAVAFGTLSLATRGFGEAINAAVSGDVEALDEALKKLAPSAREVVRAIADFGPELRELQQDLQDRLFEDLANDISFLGERILPLATFGMQNFATAINHGLQETLAYLGTRQAIRDIGTIFFNIGEAGKQLAGVIPALTRAFVDLSAVGSEFLQPIAADIDNAADRFAEWVDEARRSGDLTRIFQTALDTIKAIGQAAINTGIGIKNLFQLGPDGSLFLDTITRLSKSFREFTESAAGQQQIKDFFTEINRAGARASGILEVLARNVVGSLLPALNDLGAGLGPGVVTLLESLGDAIDNLRPALGPVGEAISTVVDALSPLLNAAGTLLGELLPPLADALTIVAEAARPIISAFARLASGLAERLGPALTDVVEALGPFLTDISEAVGPELDTLVDRLLDLADVVITQITGENLDRIVEALEEITPTMIDSLIAIVDGLINFIEQVGPSLPQLTENFTSMVVALTQFVNAVSGGIVVLAPIFGTVFGFIAGVFIRFVGVLHSVQAALFIIFDEVQRKIFEIPEWIGAVVPQIIESWLQVSTTFIEVGIQIIASVVGWLFRTQTDIAAWAGNVLVSIAGFVQSVLGFFFDLGFSIGQTLRDSLDSAQDIVFSGLQTIVSFFSALPGNVEDAIFGVISAVGDAIDRASSEGEASAQNAVSTIVSIFAGLPGLVIDAVTGIDLFSAGSSIGESFADGIRSAIGSVLDAASGLAGAVNDVLRPGSPTKKGPLSGRGWVEFSGEKLTQSFAAGIESQISAVSKAASDVARAAANPIANPVRSTFGSNFESSSIIANVGRRSGILPIGTAAAISGQQQSTSGGTVINNNMIVQSPTENPEIIAEMILNRIARRVRV